MDRISIVIPCYNEEKNLQKLLDRCREMAGKYSGLQFVLVDNGSTDNSADILSSQTAGDTLFKIVTVKKNAGYGNGILRGLEAADGTVLAWTHADLQTDPEDICKACEKYAEQLSRGHCIVKGERFNRPLPDQFFTAMMGLLASFLLGVRLHDVNAQPKIFPRSFLPVLLENAPLDFSLDTWLLYLAGKQHYEVLTYPVYFGKRTAGTAKGGGSLKGKWKLSIRTISFLFELRKKRKYCKWK